MSVKFCEQCGSLMVKIPQVDGHIIFKCRCQVSINGTNNDTLMSETYMDTDESDQKHDDFIDNAVYDPARHIVMRECPQCKLDFLTMIRVGVNETTMYVCECGFRSHS